MLQNILQKAFFIFSEKNHTKIVKIIRVFLSELGAVFEFLRTSLPLVLHKPYRRKELFQHMEFIGNQSIVIILLTGAFTGMALAYQIYLGFQLVNAENLVGPTVTLGIFKELAPVLTGLIVAARAGGAMAAQLGTMRVTEQIDAIEVMGINPKQYLIAPRLLAALFIMPFLCVLFDFAAVYSAELLSIYVLDLDKAVFWSRISYWIGWRDFLEGILKACVFGLAFAAICTKIGYTTKGGARGVGQATNKGVVYSMVVIIILNFFSSNILRWVL